MGYMEPIRTTDDNWMVNNGLRPPKVEKISFRKTETERNAWRLVHSNRPGPNSKLVVKTDNSLPKRLTVHVKNVATSNRNKFKTTYSFTCVKNDIKSVLNAYGINQNDILKLYFDGHIVK